MGFLQQLKVLIKKDLLIIGVRNWLTTLIRALIFPVVLVVILVNIKSWTAPTGLHGVGSPSPLKPLNQALEESGNSRPRVVIVNNGFTTGDIGAVVDNLSTTINQAGKELHVVNSYGDLKGLCPSSNSGVSQCYGAVVFGSSPDHGNTPWNYTYYEDSNLGGLVDASSTSNTRQIYGLPFIHAISEAIAQTQNGTSLPQINQFVYTYQTQQQVDQEYTRQWDDILVQIMGFAYVVAFSGVCFHLAGYVCSERERGLLGLMDAMMPSTNRWHPFVVRMLATHASFDLVYGPSWIIIGGVLSISFPGTNAGYLVLASILFGLALTSYSILASSLFRRPQLSAILCVTLALAFALIAQFVLSPFMFFTSTLGGAIATGLLFPPSTFVYIVILCATFDIDGTTFNPNVAPSMASFSDSYRSLYGWTAPAAPFFALFVFQIIAYPILAVVIEKSLWGTASRFRHLRSSQEMGNTAVKLNEFSRHFKGKVKKKKTMVKAVDHLSLSVPRGAITVLLGHNGSGKSTSLNAISGLDTITSGSIEVDGTGGIGICPQKNIMWDNLTVEEHVSIFEALKSSDTSSTKAQRKAEVTRLIEGCDLAVKTQAKAKTLSGGQKRKLQLAMMFAGGSQVCCIDEASSGIDPLARRRIWDILLAERGHRSMLLTTHFLDEADVLSDHVVIMSKGEMRAEGSAASLKQYLGGGYRVMIHGNIDALRIPNVKRSTDYTYTVFEVQEQDTLTKVVAELEKKNIKKYRIQGPTIENVFLKLIDEVNESTVAAEFTLPEDAERALLELHTGRGCGFWAQTWVLFKKRVIILKHNFMPYVCAVVLSLVVAGVVTKALEIDNWKNENPNGLQCLDPKDSVATPSISRLDADEVSYGLTFGPASLNSTIQALVPPCVGEYCSVNWGEMNLVNSSADYINFVKSSLGNYQVNLFYGGFYHDQNSTLFGWEADSYSSPLILALLDSVLLNQTINFGYTNFAQTYQPFNFQISLLIVFTALGFAIYPCLFALYPTAERLRNIRAMQYSNGIRASSSWTAHALFDLTFVLLISILTVIIWATQWSGWYGLGYMFVVFFLYGIASTTFSYVVSIMVGSQVAAIATTMVIQVVVGMLFFLGYTLVTIQTAPALVTTYFNYIYYTVGIISPAVHLVRGLFMVTNDFSLICRGTQFASYPGAIEIYGAPILYLLLQFFLLLFLLIFWESGHSLEIFGIHRNSKSGLEHVPRDVFEEEKRLDETNMGLRIIQSSKHFGLNRAVDDVSLGILPSEKFALTGINGAGKTTLISLIRGDLKGRGSIYIGGDNLETSPMAAKSHLGVCPQFDAQDAMTVREHLNLYADARGLPNKEHNINLLIEQLGLTPYAKKLARKLSGGNQRKLSLAIALVANPSVLLLDEPSSGMDPAAKRALWRTLSAISAGRSLLLTTHSMEEADALCDRAGIMAGRLLALGDMEDLRLEHGAAAFVHLVHQDAPHSRPEDIQRLRGFVLGQFPEAEVEMKSFGGQLRFSIPKTNLTLGQLYKLFEERKDELGIVDYSVGPSTLDEVFLNVMRSHGVQEENTEEKSGKWHRV